MDTRKILVNSVVNNRGNWNKVYQEMYGKSYSMKETDITYPYITILDSNYPEKLKQAYKPPFVLFYKGDITLINNTDIISLGVDELWDYSWSKLNELLDFNGNRHYVISGTKAVNVGIARSIKNLILVVNCGLDMVNAELVKAVLDNGGLILTEYPNGCADCEETDFTRIGSAIEQRLVVVHCDNRGYAIRQVMNSQYMGHDIYVMPTPLDSVKESKNNQLISEGAFLFYTKAQLAE